MALAMTYPGAKGETAKSLSEALCLPGNVKKACEGLGKLISEMKVRSISVFIYS
jgi:serine protease inhibitor